MPHIISLTTDTNSHRYTIFTKAVNEKSVVELAVKVNVLQSLRAIVVAEARESNNVLVHEKQKNKIIQKVL